MTTLKQLAALQTMKREMLTKVFVRSMTGAQRFAFLAKRDLVKVAAVMVWAK